MEVKIIYDPIVIKSSQYVINNIIRKSHDTSHTKEFNDLYITSLNQCTKDGNMRNCSTNKERRHIMNVLSVVLSHIYSRNLIEEKMIGSKEEILLKSLIGTCKQDPENVFSYLYSVGNRKYVDIDKLSELLNDSDIHSLDQRSVYYIMDDIDGTSLSKMTSGLVIMWIAHDIAIGMSSSDIYKDILNRSHHYLEAVCF